MTETAAVDADAPASAQRGKRPPALRLPKVVQGFAFAAFRRKTVRDGGKRFGPVFSLDGNEHRNRRKLLAPPFHGQSIKNYEKVIEEETLREIATWPEGKE